MLIRCGVVVLISRDFFIRQGVLVLIRFMRFCSVD